MMIKCVDIKQKIIWWNCKSKNDINVVYMQP